MKSIVLIPALLLSLSVSAQQDKVPGKQFDMKQYYLVLLKKGPNRTHDSATAATIMKQHLQHIEKMYEENKISLAGPMMDNGDIRGICVYHIEDMAEVKRLAESDPAVRAGRLVVEIHPWYSAKGMVLK